MKPTKSDWHNLEKSVHVVIGSVYRNYIGCLPLSEDEAEYFERNAMPTFMDEIRIATATAIHIVSVMVADFSGGGCGDCDADYLLLNYSEKMESFFALQIKNLDRIIKRSQKEKDSFQIDDILMGSVDTEECVQNLLVCVAEDMDS